MAGKVVPMSEPTPGLRLRLYRIRESLRDSWQALRAQPHEDPVFVLGTQKSGTSAIAGLLGIATGLPAAIDLKRDLDYARAPEVAEGRRPFSAFLRRHAAAFACPIVKEPNLTFLVSFLLGRWPQARLVFVVRDPVQTVRSVLDRLGLPGELDRLEPSRLEGLPRSWSAVLDSRWCEHAIAGGDPDRPLFHPVEELARRWRIAREVARSTQQARPDRTHLIEYERFRVAKEASIAALAVQLGLEVRDRDGLAAAVDRPFQPPGAAAAMPPARFFGPNLERLISAAGLDAESEPLP